MCGLPKKIVFRQLSAPGCVQCFLFCKESTAGTVSNSRHQFSRRHRIKIAVSPLKFRSLLPFNTYRSKIATARAARMRASVVLLVGPVVERGSIDTALFKLEVFMHMFLDVVGSCNLKCPSCPVGNSINANSKKPMPAGLFEQIVKKAALDGVRSLHLYNWTEPLVHPKIGEFISLVESSGIKCGISSNLNIAKNMESAIRANPSFFRISLSGFTQEVYGLGHAGGDISVVKENMIRLAELKTSLNVKTDIEVYYHRYLDNVDEESKMREFSEKLGFRFSAAFATFMPLEKTLAVVENDGSISQSDRQVMGRLALPPSPDVIDIARRHKNASCGLKDAMITLDCEGNAILCCSVFDQKKYSVGNYLELSLAEIQSRKDTISDCKSMCDRCTSHGLHVYAQTPNEGPLLKRAVENSLSFHARRLGSSIQLTSEARTVDGEADFDESTYLAENVDVATAVARGIFESGLQHYLSYGKNESRPGTPKRA